ncbi:MAG: HNH endonuclease signature motif containing protein [Nanoarchaeota archaeon]
MPNKIPIQDIISKLPYFIKIIPETYKGISFHADFIDIEYNEKFRANVAGVIRMQQGCRSRTKKRISDKLKGKYCVGVIIPLNEAKKMLPNFLEIDEKTYKGMRHKAIFYDKEYKEYFEAIAGNVLRRGKGYCERRRIDELRKCVTLSKKEIEIRLKEIHPNVKLIEYKNTKSPCIIEFNGKTVKCNAKDALSGRIFVLNLISKWRSYVLVRDNYCCQKCNNLNDSISHHILTWSKYPEQRFNINNGICLCKECHTIYHARYKNEETIENFIIFLNNKKVIKTIKKQLLLKPQYC